MKTPSYFAGLLTAPPGVAPLRVPYAPFGHSRALAPEAAPHDAEPDDTPAAAPPTRRIASRPVPSAPSRSQHAAATPATPPTSPPPAPAASPAAAQASAPADNASEQAASAPQPPSGPPDLPLLPAWKPPTRMSGEWTVTTPARPTSVHSALAAARAAAQGAAAAQPPAQPPHGEPTSPGTGKPPATPSPSARMSPRTSPSSAPTAPPRIEEMHAEASGSAGDTLDIDIEHIEVRVLPPAPGQRKASADSTRTGPLLRPTPPFGLRQS